MPGKNPPDEPYFTRCSGARIPVRKTGHKVEVIGDPGTPGWRPAIRQARDSAGSKGKNGHHQNSGAFLADARTRKVSGLRCLSCDLWFPNKLRVFCVVCSLPEESSACALCSVAKTPRRRKARWDRIHQLLHRGKPGSRIPKMGRRPPRPLPFCTAPPPRPFPDLQVALRFSAKSPELRPARWLVYDPRPACAANAFGRRSAGLHKSGAPFSGRHPKAMATHNSDTRPQGSISTTQHRQPQQPATHEHQRHPAIR